MYVAPALQLRDGDRARLEALARMSTAPAGLVQRARIVLLAARGVSNTDIAEQVGASRPTVLKWRDRYAELGIEALGDLPRPGAPGRWTRWRCWSRHWPRTVGRRPAWG